MHSLRFWRHAVLWSALSIGLQPAANAAVVTFDFDNGTPSLPTGRPTPFDQTSTGVTAHFSSVFDPAAFSTQSYATTFFQLSQFSGFYLWPGGVFATPLDIVFSVPVSEVRTTFATLDDHDPGGGGTPLLLSAHMASFLNPAVATATQRGTFIAGDRYPQGTLLLSSAQPFDRIRIETVFVTGGVSAFAVDNITATTFAQSIPEPGTFRMLGAGLVLIAASLRRRRNGVR
jgi:hypothetical protein